MPDIKPGTLCVTLMSFYHVDKHKRPLVHATPCTEKGSVLLCLATDEHELLLLSASGTFRLSQHDRYVLELV